MNQNIQDPLVQRQLTALILEIDEISSNVSSYLSYAEKRQPLLDEFVSEISLN
ncbi:MAG: hypothetical protein K2X01_03125 [Cyanobacteria bacterium]|nr:hypothetical protein [Cyanobacteriota bacterium]